MNRTNVILNELNLRYETLINGKAFLIKPKSLRYDLELILIANPDEEYEFLLWDENSIKKEYKFKGVVNILGAYNYLYACARRIADNEKIIKHRHETNN